MLRPGTSTSETVWEPALPEDLLDGVGPDAGSAPIIEPATRSRSILEHGWWPVVVWVGGLMLGAGALSDNSFLTHLATGRLIRSSGAPHRDLYSFASGGKHIVVQSWLASWWYATLEAVGGATAIRLFVSATAGALLLTLWRLSKPAASLVGRLGLVSMSATVGLLWWNERPQIIGFLALALIALVLQERRSPWWLVPLFALWVNVHGSFPLGVAYVGVVLAIRVVGARRISLREVTEVVAMAIGIVGGAAVSPYGFELLTFPIELLGRQSSLILIVEWRPLSFSPGGHLSINNIVFVAEAVAVSALLVWRRSWLRAAAAAIFIGLALMAVRNVAVAALVLIPLAAPALAGLGSQDISVAPPRRRSLLLAAVGTLLVGAFIVATPAYDLSAYPVKAVDWMQSKGYVGRTDGKNLRVLSHDYDGNYLEWRYGPDARPWIDDRAELHPFPVMRDYVLLLSGKGDTDVVLARNPHDLVLWAQASTLAQHLAEDPAYRIVYRDGANIVACRLASHRC